ncbi:unnamed protein product [Mycena citricolor]|uniref:Uncharacterized protein n=1 Tax=Mycena citricolor TaxID=2018698 RepID=A0AAD2K8R8_9AGAR|nr:unnamed protein product [Mycena citricolor]
MENLQELLIRDGDEHHCFFDDRGLHTHLPQRLIAACDMGGSPQLLEIYALEARDQRPLGLSGPPLDDGRWLSRLGDRRHGAAKTLEDYLMAPDANFNGASMLGLLFGGAMHPLIHIGCGVELGLDSLVAQGPAMCAGTEDDFSFVVADHWSTAMPKVPDVPTQGVTLFSILRQMYESPDLLSLLPSATRAHARMRCAACMYSQWSIDTTLDGAAFDAEIAKRVEKAYWQAMLLDFYLMHTLTSAIVLPRLLRALPQKLHKVQLLQGYARTCALWVIARGRPRVNPSLLMSYPNLPVPAGLKTSTATDPWAQLITNALQDFDSHVVKTVRALYSGHIHFGKVAAGQVVGAFDESGRETHPGLSKLDGTAWIRAAGITCSALGWMGFGEEAGRWDRSVLGLDAAWE